MTFPDYLVLILYFAGMAGIGWWAMKRVKKQEDYFMGGRGFGKLFQTFAAFGAGTGSADPVNTARTTFTSGMSGMWSVMYWLFVTPLYWIAAVWYRRMRCLTLGDWFTERYESKSLGAAYAAFGVLYYMVYGSMLFAAIGKVAAPLMGDTVALFGNTMALEYVLVPIIALIVIAYGVLGGVTAAYWTDVIQGICIILLSVLLLPFGLKALVAKFGNPESDGMMSGFRIMHEQLPEHYFQVVGSSNASEFPLYAILAITLINMIGIVITPHFIVTGGGTAKSEHDARIGLVTGNFIKRFCTIGWVITALIVLTLYADRPELQTDPDRTWGIATLELLGPANLGLVGLMLACLLAALMSSVDCYMIVCSALVVRNVYVPYFKKEADEATCLKLGRIIGGLVVLGAVVIAWTMMDVFKQLQLTWIVPMTFAAPFWIGMWWRRATTKAAWATVIFCVAVFFVLPKAVPGLVSSLRENATLTMATEITETTRTRLVTPSDVAKRQVQIDHWSPENGPTPSLLIAGESMTETSVSGGHAIFWDGGLDHGDYPVLKEVNQTEDNGVTTITKIYDSPAKGKGSLRMDLLLYHWIGIDLTKVRKATLSTLDLPFKILLPFVVMILFSLLSPRNSKAALDRFYVKMKTPVEPDPALDAQAMQTSYASPDRFKDKNLFAHPDFEIQRPTKKDVIGFIVCFLICFGVIGLTIWVAGIGAG